MLLNEIQSRFKDLMLDHPQALDNPGAEIAALFDEKDIPLPARLKVYRNNIVGSLTDLLIATFPLTDKLVGRGFFESMARSFILKYPPAQGCLSHYGAGFAEFIEEYEPAKNLPYLPDVAQMEIALNDSYYAKDDEALSAGQLADVAPERLPEIVLNLRDSVKLVSSRFPLTKIREFCNSSQSGTLNIDRGGETLMIHRPEMDVETVAAGAAEKAMLEALQQDTLGNAVEKILLQYPDFDFQKFLQKHILLKTFRTIP